MTDFATVYDMFFRRIEKDKAFFLYIDTDKYESMDLARERARGLLDEAVGIITAFCRPKVDFTAQSSDGFDEDLTPFEKLLISSLMYQQYLEREIAYIKNLSRDYTSTDLRVFSPSDARTSFLSLFETVKKECLNLMNEYVCTDRETGELIGVGYSSGEG